MSALSRLQPIKAELRRRQRLWQLRALNGAGDPVPTAPDAPITIYGLFGSAAGLGEAARLLAAGLESLGRTVFRVDCTPHLSPVRTVAAQAFDADPGTGPIIIHLNPVEAAEVMVALAPPGLATRRRIGVWLYELSRAPERWRDYGHLFHDIWSPGAQSRDAVAALGLDVAHVPYRHLPLEAIATKSDPERFDVLVMADFHSSLARKDVVGAVAAFQSAFAQDPRAQLLLKLSNLPSGHPLLTEARTHPQITVITETLDLPQTLALIAGADVLLSLHRAEGYGLSLVEALLLGTPIIMSDEPTTRWLQIEGCVNAVPAERVAVADPQGVYVEGHWYAADPARTVTALRTALAEWKAGIVAENRHARIARADTLLCDTARLDALRDALGRSSPRTKKADP